jgi:hypothetical protein
MATDRSDGPTTSEDDPRINLGGLFWAAIFAVVAVVGFTGNFSWVFENATKWILAAVVALIGLGLLLTALPRRGGSQ